ncbi:MAG: hypothetical protein JSS81_27800 [Acidobacteria bacterium]|nr:hypothetical protein [Acidobacteriota bacterium]
MNYIFKLLTLVLLFYSLSGCVESHIQKRLDDEDTRIYIKHFRSAETEYRRQFNSFGTIEDLIENKLLDEKFADHQELDFNYSLEADKYHYRLSVVSKFIAEAIEKDQDEISYYLDESGVIRVSINPRKLADKTSTSIAYQ